MKKSVVAAVVILIVAILYAVFLIIPSLLFSTGNEVVDQPIRLDPHWQYVTTDWGNTITDIFNNTTSVERIKYYDTDRATTPIEIDTKILVVYEITPLYENNVNSSIELRNTTSRYYPKPTDSSYKPNLLLTVKKGELYGYAADTYWVALRKLLKFDFTVYKWVE